MHCFLSSRRSIRADGVKDSQQARRRIEVPCQNEYKSFWAAIEEDNKEVESRHRRDDRDRFKTLTIISLISIII